jgi:hypothetical protein
LRAASPSSSAASSRSWSGSAIDKAGQQAAATIAAIARRLGYEDVRVYPVLPPIGQHFEELHDPSAIARIKAEPVPLLPREDQAGD